MKRVYLTLLFITIISSSFAQWTTIGSNVNLTSGNAEIGTPVPTHSLTFSSASTGVAVYNTSDQTGNYERFVQQYQSNVFTLGSFFGSSGTPRSIKIGVQENAGTTNLTGGRVFTLNSNISAAAGNFDFSSSNSYQTGSLFTLNTTTGSSSYRQNMFAIQGTVTQSGGAAYAGLLIAPFESTIGSGPNYLIDAGTNSAASGGGTHTPKFTVDDTGNGWFVGNVGISTTDNGSWQLATSTYKLAVNGGVIATGVTVKLRTYWPDYVFKRGYKMPSLTAVKNYIELNHHLPEMPSAADVAKNGLNLGEMNKLLAKKVEELTLYLIDKDKQLNEQNQKIQEQEVAIQNQEKRLRALEEALLKLTNSTIKFQ